MIYANPKLRFPQYKESWVQWRIGDLTQRISIPVDVKQDELYTQIGVRSHGKGLFHKEPVTGKELGNKRVFWVKEDLFVVNIVFAWEQAVAKTTANEIGTIASHRFPMFRPEPSLLNLDFLLFSFLTKRGKNLLELASPGGAGRNKTLGQEDFNRTKVNVPCVEEQNQIAAFLSAIDEKIGRLARKKELFLKYKNGAMRQIFDQSIRFKDDKGNDFADWEDIPFHDIARLRKERFDASIGESRKCLELEHLDQDTGKLLGIIDSKAQKSVKNVFVTGDILFGKLRPYLKKYWYATFEGVCSTEIWVMNPRKGYQGQFLYYLMQTPAFFHAVSVSSGSKMPRAEWDLVSECILSVPTDENEQKKIADFFSTLDQEIEQTNRQLILTKSFKKGLLQQMFV